MVLLIAEPVLAAAIGALPGDAVARHAPHIFVHAGLADAETAAALPAKGERLPATVALLNRVAAFVFSAGRFGRIGHGILDSWFGEHIFGFGASAPGSRY